MRVMRSPVMDMLRLLPSGGPVICNVAVTNVCNAKCEFCNYAHDKGLVTDRAYIDADRFPAALDILHARGIRYITFSGGEPLLHPRLAEMMSAARARHMRPQLVTNGWLLPKRCAELRAVGIRTVFISLDAATVEAHETNRGLKGVCARIREATTELRAEGVRPIASVTINRLIDDLDALPAFLGDLGFDAVTFSYPKRTALGTSSLVWSDSSGLIDFRPEELIERFSSIAQLRNKVSVLNPAESMEDMIRHLRGEPEEFVCFGGYKYFYMDWRFDIYRCDSWDRRMCTVWDFESTPLIRDGCTRCMSDCYRDSSVYLGLPVAIGDAIQAGRRAQFGGALTKLLSRPARRSAKALLAGSEMLSTLWQTR